MDLSYSIDKYIHYCDSIKQYYKQYNINEDDMYKEYLSLKSNKDRESFINRILISKRINKIDNLLF